MKSKEDLKAAFLQHIEHMAGYWADRQNMTDREKLDGLVYSILGMLDGEVSDLPAFDLVPALTDEDRGVYCPDPINDDTCLHEDYLAFMR